MGLNSRETGTLSVPSSNNPVLSRVLRGHENQFMPPQTMRHIEQYPVTLTEQLLRRQQPESLPPFS